MTTQKEQTQNAKKAFAVAISPTLIFSKQKRAKKARALTPFATLSAPLAIRTATTPPL